MIYFWVHTFLRLGAVLIFGFRVQGYRNPPLKGPGWFLLSNHQSHLDPVLTGIGTPALVCFMARDTLFRSKLFGGLIRSLRAFPIARGTRDEGAFRQTQELIAEGFPVVIFGEGTRSSDGEIQPLKGGIEILTRRTGAAVVPASVCEPIRVMPRGRSLLAVDVHPLLVVYGPPITADEYQTWPKRQMPEKLRDKLLELQLEARMAHRQMGRGVTTITSEPFALFLLWSRCMLSVLGAVIRLVKGPKQPKPDAAAESAPDSQPDKRPEAAATSD